MAAEPVNVLCLKWGDMYGPEYVNILYAMVARNLNLPFRFVCFTENAQGLDDGIEVQPLPEFEEPPWEYARICSAWRKLALFEQGLADLTGPCLFLDLDVAILDNIDDFFELPEACAVRMINNWYQPGKGQASAFAFEAGKASYLLDYYRANTLEVLVQYRTEQAFISGHLPERCAFFPEPWCKSYKKHVMPSGLARWSRQPYPKPEGAKMLVFHGRPNPPDAIKGRWGKRFAWYKRWYKTIQPNDWLAQYWRL